MLDATVVIPAWNAQHVIGRAINSALTQREVRVEIIVVDDASSDGTQAAVASFADPRVHYIWQSVNGGPAAARNAALDAACGRWIAVLDADDEMLPTRLHELIGAAAEHRLDIIADNMWVEDVRGRRTLFLPEALDGGIEMPGFADYVLRNRLFGSRPGDGYLKPIFSAAFLRRHALRYDASVRIGEDFLLMAEALALGARYGRRRSAGYIYTTQAGSISRRLRTSDAETMIAADRRFLARYGSRLGRTERAAMAGHLRSLKEGASFTAMVEDIKARNLLALARRITTRPAAVRHFAMPIRARLERAGLLARP
jgi:succinoglycan biosynthesis protein ExoO